MKVIAFVFEALFTCIFMTGCATGYISTMWKNDHAYPGNYNKIMIAAIVNSNDTMFRKEIENHFKEALESRGYTAISSFSEFGTGLKDLGQEDTYRKLCDKGIDAVMTVALVDKTKSSELSSRSYSEPVNFFYDRIWHYRDVQIPVMDSEAGMKYSWEVILFDLSTLQPHYIAQTQTANGTVEQSMQREFWNAVVKKLRKDRFLKNRPPVNHTNGPKAF